MVNGSFEDTISCPWSNDLNNGQLELAKGWWKPTLGTSDFYHRCNDDIVGVPNNFWGYQEPYHGDGYVGLGVIGWHTNTSEIFGYEYIQSKLTTPLIACHQYQITFYVSLSDYTRYGVGKLGTLFTKEEIDQQNEALIQEQPQFINNYGVIGDTSNWTKISGLYTAKGGEEFLTLGYFFDSFENDTVFIHNMGAFPDQGFAYFYYDSISLIEIGIDSSCEVIFPNTFSPNNDNVNDCFSIEHLTGLSGSYEVKILNRWGEVISVLNKDNQIWNGESSMGKDCPEGVYYFTYEFEFNGEQRLGSGYIHLFR